MLLFLNVSGDTNINDTNINDLAEEQMHPTLQCVEMQSCFSVKKVMM